MAKIKGPSVPPVSEPESAKSPSAPSAPSAPSSGKAQEDIVSPDLPVESPSSASRDKRTGLKPPSSALPGASETGSSASVMIPPASSLLQGEWRAYRETHAGEADRVMALLPRYQQLTGLVEQLSGEYEEIRVDDILAEDSTPSAESSPPSRSYYREGQKQLRRGVVHFIRQLKSPDLMEFAKRARLKKQIKKKISALACPPLPEVHFMAMYSWFVQTHGRDLAREQELPSPVEELEGDWETVKASRLFREQQRAHLMELAEITTNVADLEKLQDDVGELEVNVKSHYETHDDFVAEYKHFGELFESMTAGMAKLGRSDPGMVTRLKKRLGRELGTLRGLSLVSSAFKEDYRQALLQVDSLVVERSGLEQAHLALTGLYENNETTRGYIQFCAQTLEERVVDAGELTTLEQLQGGVSFLTGMTERYEEEHRGWVSAASEFEKRCQAMVRDHSLGALAERVTTLHGVFQQAPEVHEVFGNLSELFFRVLEEHREDSDRPKWVREFVHLDAELHHLRESEDAIYRIRCRLVGLLREVSSERGFEKLKRDVKAYRRIIRDHNARSETFLSGVDQFFVGLPEGSDLGLSDSLRPLSSGAGAALLSAIGDAPEGSFLALRIKRVAVDDEQVNYPTPGDRLKAIEELVSTSSIDVVNREGNGLAHETIRASHLGELEKIAILRGLGKLGADLNFPDSHGFRPLHRALELPKTQSLVVQALKELGARLPPSEQACITAHFLGVGGTLPSHDDRSPHPGDIVLGGLSERMAEDALDPVFRRLLEGTGLQPGAVMQSALGAAHNAWRETRDYPAFISALSSAKGERPGDSEVPAVIITRWDHPNRHVIGFVLNVEADGCFLYACNTGDIKEVTRSIVKYKIVDFEKTLRFFNTCSRDSNETRPFCAGPPSLFGLRRCPEAEQLPPQLDKASQKRGNSSMAARKACALAMLWSVSRSDDVDPGVVKSTYKELTTGLRREGIERAMDSGIPALQGRALVSLLIRFDRPDSPALAYELANVIMRQRSPRFWWKRKDAPVKVPETDSPQYLGVIRAALKATGQNISTLKTRYDEDLAVHAERKGHPEATRILRAVTDSPPLFTRI